MRTADGWSLRVDVRAPERKAIGVAVLAHALMTRRTEFDRPANAGLGSFLAERGWRVLTFDFRGHGESRPTPREGGTFGYDALVTKDLPAVCELARAEGGDALPVVVVGHSLGGHVALAAQASGAIRADAVTTFAASLWLRHLDRSTFRWWTKRATAEAMVAIARRVGYFPARALRMGSDDEPRELLEDMNRVVRSGAWTSADGRVDYASSLAHIGVPVLQVLSDRDTFECDPESGARFVEPCGARAEILAVTQGDDGSEAPSHMGLLTGGKVRGVWTEVETWMRKAVV